MKKSSIKKIFAAVIIIIVFIILFAFILRKPASEPPIPTFDFLNGRKLTARIEEKTSVVSLSETLFVYSFEADFNDKLRGSKQ